MFTNHNLSHGLYSSVNLDVLKGQYALFTIDERSLGIGKVKDSQRKQDTPLMIYFL